MHANNLITINNNQSGYVMLLKCMCAKCVQINCNTLLSKCTHFAYKLC